MAVRHAHVWTDEQRFHGCHFETTIRVCRCGAVYVEYREIEAGDLPGCARCWGLATGVYTPQWVQRVLGGRE